MNFDDVYFVSREGTWQLFLGLSTGCVGSAWSGSLGKSSLASFPTNFFFLLSFFSGSGWFGAYSWSWLLIHQDGHQEGVLRSEPEHDYAEMFFVLPRVRGLHTEIQLYSFQSLSALVLDPIQDLLHHFRPGVARLWPQKTCDELVYIVRLIANFLASLFKKNCQNIQALYIKDTMG